MTWARLDDVFPNNRKVVRLSDKAFRLHVAAICYSAQLGLDGVVTRTEIPRLIPGYKASALSELMEMNWHGDGHDCSECPQPGKDAIVIHDYLKSNPSRAAVIEKQEAATERKRRYAEKKQAEEREKERERERKRNASRDAPPSRPDPARQGYGSESGFTVGGDGDPDPSVGSPPSVFEEMPAHEFETILGGLRDQLRNPQDAA